MASADTEALKRLKNLSSLPADQLELLRPNLKLNDFRKSEAIFNQGDRAKQIHLLVEGVVMVAYNDFERQTVVGMLSPGDFFGFDALLPNGKHPFRCTAYEPSIVGSINPRRFVEIMLGCSYEKFRSGFGATLHLTNRLHVHCVRGIALDLRRRLALELLDLANRFGEPNGQGTIIKLAISHETLAEIVGASRQQVTEYLNEFVREELIQREGRRIIVRAERLQKIVDAGP